VLQDQHIVWSSDWLEQGQALDNKRIHISKVVSVGTFPQGLWSQDEYGKLIIWDIIHLD